jgi:hypothetical protein
MNHETLLVCLVLFCCGGYALCMRYALYPRPDGRADDEPTILPPHAPRKVGGSEADLISHLYTID